MRCRTNAASAIFALSICFASPALAQDEIQTIMPENPDALAFQTAVGYSEAVIVDGMVYLSGVVAGPAPGETTMTPGFTRAFEQIGKTLERSGSSWGDVVTFDTFHTDLAGQINEFVEVKNRYIKAPFPAWTALEVSGLYEPTAWVEIKIMARVSAAD
ncbi:Rid family hydrolase [Altererythrobacter sp. ZODW24]|uniref:Rid family hydrolase n=1 Tax=Altererythrobacter sp. ZODW24 TaxID=2185142 RepID=UPI000DF7F73F|nr:Rid family hydrolase [Altererythrobacter sp. ZODW24]